MSQKSIDCGSALLTPSDVALRLRISERQIYNLVADDGFPSPMKVGRQNRWRELDISCYVERLAKMTEAA